MWKWIFLALNLIGSAAYGIDNNLLGSPTHFVATIKPQLSLGYGAPQTLAPIPDEFVMAMIEQPIDKNHRPKQAARAAPSTSLATPAKLFSAAPPALTQGTCVGGQCGNYGRRFQPLRRGLLRR